MDGPRVFSYTELRKVTKNFSHKEMLGNGSSGTVYRGCLDSPPGTLVAVKRITHARWCHEKGRLLLDCDYMPNGSLSECLYEMGRNPCNPRNMLSLKCDTTSLKESLSRLSICKKTVCCIIHRNIKSSNIVLDSDFRAHVGDFGLARLLDQSKVEKITLTTGTLGYMAPEISYTGKATKESDIYSFCILVLEVICGRRPLDVRAQEPDDIVLLQTVWRAHAAGELLSMADPRLLQPASSSSSETSTRNANSSFASSSSSSSSQSDLSDMDISISIVEDEAAKRKMIANLLHLGLLCCPKARPSMRHVNRMLLEMGANSNQNDVISMPPLPTSTSLGLYSLLGILTDDPIFKPVFRCEPFHSCCTRNSQK